MTTDLATALATYPTAQRWAECIETARRVASRPTSFSDWNSPQYWWRYTSPLPMTKPFVRWEAHRAYDRRLHLKRRRHAKLHRCIAPSVRREVLSSGPCVYCGGPAEVIDHLIPVSRGGTRFRRNLAPACDRCNRQKSDMTAEEYVQHRWATVNPLDHGSHRVIRWGPFVCAG